MSYNGTQPLQQHMLFCEITHEDSTRSKELFNYPVSVRYEICML
jgi:hypothetical protein